MQAHVSGAVDEKDAGEAFEETVEAFEVGLSHFSGVGQTDDDEGRGGALAVEGVFKIGADDHS